jgi:glutamate-1-semialdehyde aminotransferase/acyl carrier protein
LAAANTSVAIAAENSPKLCVVAGRHEAIEAFRLALERDNIVAKSLYTSHAFHSPMMNGLIAPFEAEVAKTTLSSPLLPIFSTVTSEVLSATEATNPHYWAKHLREPVRFSPTLTNLLRDHTAALLEVGPRTTLTMLARQHVYASTNATPIATASLGDQTDNETVSIRLAAAKLWTLGVELDLGKFDQREKKRRVLVPTYPFERQRFWLEAKPAQTMLGATPRPLTVLSTQTTSATETITPFSNTIPTTEVQEQAMTTTSTNATRIPDLIAQLRQVFEDTSGIDMADADATTNFVELGLDSLSLTQIAIQVKQTFKVNVTFRQLMESQRTLESLAAHLDGVLPASTVTISPSPAAAQQPSLALSTTAVPVGTINASLQNTGAPQSLVQQVIQQQMQLMAQQLALLNGSGSIASTPASQAVAATTPVAPAVPQANAAPAASASAKNDANASADDAPNGPLKYDAKKAFGAIARIYTDASNELTDRQQKRLDAFMRRYIARTEKSKALTQEHRPHLADPRVVNGFRPMLKEIIYQIVIDKSKGSKVWDIDGNEYVDVLNGFGMNMFGWQPDFVQKAVKQQLDDGYEIGPQHPLAGEVAKLVCEVTGHDRAGLCNTGSEAVMGTVRIARTVTGRNLIAIFTGSYHGIFDEVIVRATKKLKAVPAAPGIMPNTSQNVLVLDYGTPESMQILKERAHELAAVVVECVQSRRPDFQPREFLQELREVTKQSGTLLIFDEVVTGFRSHPGGIQALFGIQADLCSYGKVVGGGFPIGVIAGKREYMDALDGGHWQYGDDSIPTVGVTYFAGTFVRHPLALAAAKAVLLHLKEHGPKLQSELTLTTTAMVAELNAFCEENGAPIVLKSFASVWKTFFTEEHPLQDLLFGMMRSRGVHILDNFPCFFTTAHTPADIAIIKTAFKESVIELQEAGFIPKRKDARAVLFDADNPPVPGARIGKDPAGNPAWFVPNPDAPGKYLRLDA